MNIVKRHIAANALAITPNDSTDLPRAASGGLLVVTAGNIVLKVGNATITMTGVTVNSVIPLAATRVMATGTTAVVVALY